MSKNVPYTIAAAGRLLDEGCFSAEELAKMCLARAHEEEDLNSFVTLDERSILRQARDADNRRARGIALGLFDGVPIALKDNIDVVGMPCSAGSSILKDRWPALDAQIVVKLRSAGFVIFGKTGMCEFALSSTSNNKAFGAVRNPFNVGRTAGGSSSGSAVAVAAGIVPAAIGTDTGGSIRLPASYCGLLGYRPTLGRWPTDGMVPLSRSRDTAGPLARSIEDIAAIDRLMARDSPFGFDFEPKRKFRFGIPYGYLWLDLDPDVRELSLSAVQVLRDDGHEIVDVTIPSLNEDLAAALSWTVLYEARNEISEFLFRECGGKSLLKAAELSDGTDARAFFSAIADSSGESLNRNYHDLHNERLPRLGEDFERAFDKGVDALIYPVSPVPAPPLDEEASVLLNGCLESLFPVLIRNTNPAAALGLPGLTLPIGKDASGVPLGLAIDLPHGRDLALLTLGAALEELFPCLVAAW